MAESLLEEYNGFLVDGSVIIAHPNSKTLAVTWSGLLGENTKSVGADHPH
jgi:hypothetical protein